jgi:hypothetical protein
MEPPVIKQKDIQNMWSLSAQWLKLNPSATPPAAAKTEFAESKNNKMALICRCRILNLHHQVKKVS